jgi:hypothetical protein
LFGVPISALALISLLHKIFSIGLAPVFHGIVELWHKLTDPFASILKYPFSLIHITLPDWYVDAFILSFILSAIYFKNLFAYRSPRQPVSNLFATWIFSALFSLIILGPLIILTIFGGNVKNDETLFLSNTVKKDILAVISAVIVFYVLNATAR